MEVLTHAIETTFQDVRKLIYDIVHRYRRRYGGEWDELISEAYEVFIVAFWAHDDRSQFTTYLSNTLHWRLTDNGRKRKDQTNTSELLEGLLARDRSAFRNLLSELSEDAKEVCELILETPAKRFKAACRQNRQEPLELLKYHLKSCGWEYPRISNTFTEIRSALR